MLAKRIIPCLDVRDGRVVKGVNFVNIRDAGDPVELATYYSQQGADEIVFLDITATYEARKTVADVVRKTVQQVFVPVTVGGGIRTLEDFRQPYVELQELESTPVVLFDPSSGHDSRAYREHSLLAPAWYSVTQQARSPENGASCYAPQLEAMYFRLLLPSMARSVAQAQMEQYRLVNLSWSYETLEHPGLDFVLLAREPEGLWQMAALGRGGQVAVYIYCGQEQLRDHLDLLSSWRR